MAYACVQVHQIMTRNIAEVLERGERLDSESGTASSDSTVASSFSACRAAAHVSFLSPHSSCYLMTLEDFIWEKL